MPGIALDGMGDRQHLTDVRIVSIESAFDDSLARHVVDLVPPRHESGEPLHLFERQSKCLAHIAQRALASIRDHLADHRGALAAVALVDGLNHFFAPLVLEVDVDIRWLATLAGEKPFEQQIAPRWIDGGDAEAVADSAIGRTPAPLAENVL